MDIGGGLRRLVRQRLVSAGGQQRQQQVISIAPNSSCVKLWLWPEPGCCAGGLHAALKKMIAALCAHDCIGILAAANAAAYIDAWRCGKGWRITPQARRYNLVYGSLR